MHALTTAQLVEIIRRIQEELAEQAEQRRGIVRVVPDDAALQEPATADCPQCTDGLLMRSPSTGEWLACALCGHEWPWAPA